VDKYNVVKMHGNLFFVSCFFLVQDDYRMNSLVPASQRRIWIILNNYAFTDHVVNQLIIFIEEQHEVHWK